MPIIDEHIPKIDKIDLCKKIAMFHSQPHTPARQRGLQLKLRGGLDGNGHGPRGPTAAASDGSASAGHDGSAAQAAVAQLPHDEPAAAATGMVARWL